MLKMHAIDVLTRLLNINLHKKLPQQLNHLSQIDFHTFIIAQV